jgi:hypothetical protein
MQQTYIGIVQILMKIVLSSGVRCLYCAVFVKEHHSVVGIEANVIWSA